MIAANASTQNNGAELQSIKTFFASSHIILSEEWLQSCVEWLKEENEGPNLTEQELRSQVYEQWLLLDFADLHLPILPPNVTGEMKFILKKSVCLQVVTVVDISRPKLQQIMEMRKSVAGDHRNEDNPCGKRVLQLKLTDGVQEILATEYQPINFLSLNLTPGAKVCLSAPLVIRRGQVMLRPGSIKVLGGEVDKILVSNAAENVLAGFLNLPVNPKPAYIVAHFDDSDMEIFSESGNETKPAIKPEMHTTPASTSTPLHHQSAAKKERDSILTELQDPALFDGSDFEEEMRTASPRKPNAPVFLEDVFDGDEFEEMMIAENAAAAPSPVKRPMTIEKLNSLAGKVNRGNFRVHARFKSVAEKMMMKDDEYTFKLCLQDETDEGIFAVHSSVVADMMGYSPRALAALKDRVAEGDKVAISAIYLAMEQFKDKLVNLDNDMMVLLEAGSDCPIVTRLLE